VNPPGAKTPTGPQRPRGRGYRDRDFPFWKTLVETDPEFEKLLQLFPGTKLDTRIAKLWVNLRRGGILQDGHLHFLKPRLLTYNPDRDLSRPEVTSPINALQFLENFPELLEGYRECWTREYQYGRDDFNPVSAMTAMSDELEKANQPLTREWFLGRSIFEVAAGLFYGLGKGKTPELIRELAAEHRSAFLDAWSRYPDLTAIFGVTIMSTGTSFKDLFGYDWNDVQQFAPHDVNYNEYRFGRLARVTDTTFITAATQHFD
jgi:hypothetical protein